MVPVAVDLVTKNIMNILFSSRFKLIYLCMYFYNFFKSYSAKKYNFRMTKKPHNTTENHNREFMYIVTCVRK